MITDPIINSQQHIYDWKIKNKKIWKNGMRRFWICWNKNVDEKQLFKINVLV
tara:strand:+ start:952 stop:1107 length:156 start_codon:yes stop_codon:yes gene_type:complete